MIRNFSIEKEEILNEQIKEFIERYNTPYSWELIDEIESYLNYWCVECDIENIQSWTKYGTKFVDIKIPQIEGFGHNIEEGIYQTLLKGRFYLGINEGFKNRNPNGAMQFPDYEFGNGIWADSKAVICKPLKNKDNYSKNYNSGLGDRDEIVKELKTFCDSNILNQKTSALIILTYYTFNEIENKIEILKIKIIPYLFYISCYKDEHDFAIKQCTDGDVKNANVQGRLNIKEGSCEVYLDKIRRTIKNIESREK